MRYYQKIIVLLAILLITGSSISIKPQQPALAQGSTPQTEPRLVVFEGFLRNG
jgi:hypothetical protein